MKKLFLSSALLLSIAAFAQTSTYTGNDSTGFGGAIGKGTLSITDNGTSVTFALTKGPGDLNDIVVFYVDFTTGGITSTAGLTNQANKYEKAVSGKDVNTDPARNAVLNFPAAFQPDAAMAFDRDGGKTYFFGFGQMIEGNAPQVTPTGTATAPVYSQTINKSDLSQGNGPLTFKFLGTYISGTAYRSDESFGDPFIGYRKSQALQPAQGWVPYTATSFFTYTSIALPVKVTDVKAVKVKDNVQVNWSVADETNINEYQVQRSANGTLFTTVGTVKAKNGGGVATYSFADASAVKGVNYYRLLVVENGKKDYSKVVSIKNTLDKNSFNVTAQGSVLTVKLTGIDAGTYRLSVMNTSGQLLQSISLQHDGADLIKQVDMKSTIVKGVYRITLQGESEQFIKSILVQ